MRTIIYGDSPVDSPETSNALARSLATVEPTETNFKPLTRTLVGRPGLDPGTLGFEPERMEASVVVRVAWSEESASPPTSADVLANLVPWLHDWLHSLGIGVSSVVQISGSEGLKIEVRVE